LDSVSHYHIGKTGKNFNPEGRSRTMTEPSGSRLKFEPDHFSTLLAAAGIGNRPVEPLANFAFEYLVRFDARAFRVAAISAACRNLIGWRRVESPGVGVL
jgi:hypothetical protein